MQDPGCYRRRKGSDTPGTLDTARPAFPALPARGWQNFNPSHLSEREHTQPKSPVTTEGERKALAVSSRIESSTLQEMKQKRTRIVECNIISHHWNSFEVLPSMAKRKKCSHTASCGRKQAELAAGLKPLQLGATPQTELLSPAELEPVEGVQSQTADFPSNRHGTQMPSSLSNASRHLKLS